MKGKAELLKDVRDGKVREVTVEVVNAPVVLADARRTPIEAPSDGRVLTAHQTLRPTDATVRWCHPAEVVGDPKTGAKNYRGAQSGTVWLDTDGVPVVVHGGCFGVFPLESVIVLSDGTEDGVDGASNVELE